MSRDFDELLSAYLDGEATPEERAVVERKLEQSPALRETLDELSEVGELVRGLPRPRAPVDLPERVVAAIGNPSLSGKSVPVGSARWRRAWPLVAAAAVLAAGVAVVVMLPDRAAPRLAKNEATPAVKSAFGVEPADRRLSEDRSSLAAGTLHDFDTNLVRGEAKAETPTESLTDRIRKLDRPPAQGDVIDILRNSPETHVVRYYVVDTRQTADSMKVILADNKLDVVVTETPTPVPALTKSSDQETTYWYFEGPTGNVDNALKKIGTLKTVNGVVDEGPLAEDGETPVELDLKEQPPLASSDAIQLKSETVADQPAGGVRGGGSAPAMKARRQTAPKAAAPAAAPALAPQQPASLAGASAGAAGPADKKPAGETTVESLIVGKEDLSKSKGNERVADPEPQAGSNRDAAGVAVGNPAAQSNSRGVSAQLDSQSVEPLMRNRFFLGNSVQSNSVQSQNVNQLQRRLQPEFNSPRAADEKQRAVTETERLSERKARESDEASQQSRNLYDAANSRRNLQTPTNLYGRGVVNAEGRAKALVILQNGVPEAAAASPAAAVPAVPAQKP